MPQPRLQAADADTADRRRRLVARQQDERPTPLRRQSALRSREELQKLGPQPIDLPGAVTDQVVPAPRQRPQIAGDLVTGPQEAKVLPHASLVREDMGVPGVGLALPAVAARGMVHGQAGEVDHRLLPGQQQPDQQGSAAVGGVHGPQHLTAVGQREHVAEQL